MVTKDAVRTLHIKETRKSHGFSAEEAAQIEDAAAAGDADR